MTAAAIHVLRPGLLTSVQDLGRWGHQASGVPVAGPMDSFSHRLANLLVGNSPGAAALEITLVGPELEFEAAAMVAVCGAEFEVTGNGQPVANGTSVALPAGTRLHFGRRRTGARAYLAVSGGIQTTPTLGSRATHLPSAMGGYHGRALAAGDRLPIAVTLPQPALGKSLGLTLPAGRARLRVLPGPQADWFPGQAMQTLTSVSFRISSRSNRMAYRLEGPPLLRTRAAEPISEPLAFGAIQVPTAGEPFLLMADRQTAGGYPKIASVISADLPIAGQLAPGDFVEFAVCSPRDAATALIARERPLLRIVDVKFRA